MIVIVHFWLYSLVPNRKKGKGRRDCNSWGAWKNPQNLISMGSRNKQWGWKIPLNLILFLFLSNIFLDLHLYKRCIYIDSLCWMELLPKFNSRRVTGVGVGKRMSWQEKFWKINYQGGCLLGTKEYLALASIFLVLVKKCFHYQNIQYSLFSVLE